MRLIIEMAFIKEDCTPKQIDADIATACSLAKTWFNVAMKERDSRLARVTLFQRENFIAKAKVWP